MADSTEYKKALQTKLVEILTGLFNPQDRDTVNKFFSLDSLNSYWIPAFTHVTGNPEYMKNYEVFEYIGDRFVNTVFTKYIENLSKRRGVPLSQEERTLLLNNYMSRDFQAQKAEEMGLANFLIRSPEVEITKKIHGDLFESLFGALVELTDDLITPGMGYVYAFNLMEKMMHSIQIDFSTIQRPIITQLKELFDIITNATVVPSYFYEPSDLVGYSNKASVRDPAGKVIGVGYGNDKDEAQRSAASEAIKTLARQGYTRESLQEERDTRIRKVPEYDHQYRRIEQFIQLNNNFPDRGKIGGFKIYDEKTDTPQGKITSYILRLAFLHPDGIHQIWRDVGSKVGEPGQEPTFVRIALMKEFADKFNIPP